MATEKVKILIVDDRPENLLSLEALLADPGYELLKAGSGPEALDCLLHHNDVAAILLDIQMPGMDGYETAESIRSRKMTCRIPILFLTAFMTGQADIFRGYASGAVDYLTRPCSPAVLRSKVEVFADLFRMRRELERRVQESVVLNRNLQASEAALAGLNRELEGRVARRMGEIWAQGEKLRETCDRLKGSLDQTASVAARMGFSDERIEGLCMAAKLHDLGNIALPSEILSNPGRLTKNQFLIVQEHPEIGHRILRGIDFPWPVAEIVRQHHERFDGSGYPQGIEGKDILPEATVLAVADVVEAMNSHRPYRMARGMEAALAELIKGRGVLYEPETADACCRLFEETDFRLT